MAEEKILGTVAPEETIEGTLTPEETVEGNVLASDVVIMRGVGSSISIGYVELFADKWVGDASPYSQVVTIDGVTEYSQVDLTPSAEQLDVFHNKDLAFVAENEDGVVTVYAVGDKPANDYTMQVTIKEIKT